VFPDRSAEGERVGEHLYGVRFSARELWGADRSAGDGVRIDLWEPYLEVVE
jgi:nitrile hydratase